MLIVYVLFIQKLGDKPHACELCNKRFALACNLRAHMKTHEGTSYYHILIPLSLFLSLPFQIKTRN